MKMEPLCSCETSVLNYGGQQAHTNVVIRQISSKHGQLAALEGRVYVITKLFLLRYGKLCFLFKSEDGKTKGDGSRTPLEDA